MRARWLTTRAFGRVIYGTATASRGKPKPATIQVAASTRFASETNEKVLPTASMQRLGVWGRARGRGSTYQGRPSGDPWGPPGEQLGSPAGGGRQQPKCSGPSGTALGRRDRPPFLPAAASRAVGPFALQTTVRWELRVRRTNQPPSLCHLIPLSARGYEWERDRRHAV